MGLHLRLEIFRYSEAKRLSRMFVCRGWLNAAFIVHGQVHSCNECGRPDWQLKIKIVRMLPSIHFPLDIPLPRLP